MTRRLTVNANTNVMMINYLLLMGLLTAHQHPIRVNELWQEAYGDARPAGMEWAALWIMRLGGLVRFTHDSVLATDVGREVQRRIIQPLVKGEFRRRPSIYDSLFVPNPVDTRASSHLQRVREACRGKPPEFLQLKHVAPLSGIGQLRMASQPSNTSSESLN